MHVCCHKGLGRGPNVLHQVCNNMLLKNRLKAFTCMALSLCHNVGKALLQDRSKSPTVHMIASHTQESDWWTIVHTAITLGRVNSWWNRYSTLHEFRWAINCPLTQCMEWFLRWVNPLQEGSWHHIGVGSEVDGPSEAVPRVVIERDASGVVEGRTKYCCRGNRDISGSVWVWWKRTNHWLAQLHHHQPTHLPQWVSPARLMGGLGD